MISPQAFLASLQSQGIDFFTGLPDPVIKPFLDVLATSVPPENNIVCANEGNAIALAAGYHLGSGKIPLVYMQNAGLGNAVNPLMSLCHDDVYGIPLLLIVGWSGQPDSTDEPQHIPMGAATMDLLRTLGTPYSVLDDSLTDADELVTAALAIAQNCSKPFAFLCKKNTFDSEVQEPSIDGKYSLNREAAVTMILEKLPIDYTVVCSAGYVGQEVLAHRVAKPSPLQRDFLNDGAMGHTSQIALGIALANPNKNVLCLDGDGSAITHMGGLAIIGSAAPPNLKHVILNNGAHESVGGQPTAGFKIDFVKIANACGYPAAGRCETDEALRACLDNFLNMPQLALLEVRIKSGGRDNLPRPSAHFQDRKNRFIQFSQT